MGRLLKQKRKAVYFALVTIWRSLSTRPREIRGYSYLRGRIVQKGGEAGKARSLYIAEHQRREGKPAAALNPFEKAFACEVLENKRLAHLREGGARAIKRGKISSRESAAA